MEIQFNPDILKDEQTEQTFESIALGRMISQLISHFQAAAVLHENLIVNDVPTGFYVDVDRNILVTVISRLFGSIISRTKNSCIRVSAKRYNDIILLRMSDASGAINSFNNHDWHELEAMAEKVGGCIIADDVRKKPANIIFSFRCLANAA